MLSGSKRQVKAALIAATAVMCAAGAAYAVYRSKSHEPRISTSSAEYVDAATCDGCHESIAKSYRQTGMGRSLSRPDRGNIAEATFSHRASDRDYTIVQRGGEWFERRHQAGYEGKTTNVIERRVDYVVGSGNHARTYLHRSADGKLVELPVSWYAENGGSWAMSPGYDRPDQQDFRRSIEFNCVFCHDAYPESAAGTSVYDAPRFREPLPLGIDCQRCHGPGRRHVEAAGSGKASREAIRRLIVNPARLDRDRQLEICMQCHLEPTSRPLPNVIARYGRGLFSFRPGEPLADSFLFFDHAPGSGWDDNFEVAHAAYRLRKSKCFQASAMTCSTCHNPHDAPRGEQAVSRYTAGCRSCHASAHASGAPGNGSCTDCHMPRRRADDAVHVVMTDHYIRRRKPDRDLLAPLPETERPYRGEVSLYYGSAHELYLAVAQVQDGSNPNGIPRLRTDLERLKPEAPEAYLELAKAYSKSGDPREASRWCDEALRRRPGFRPALKELGAALIAAGQLPRAVEVLQSITDDSVALTNLGNANLRLGRIEAAERALAEALRLDPDSPEANNLLGMLRSQQGDGAAADRYFRIAIAGQPDFAEAHHNLANLLASGRDYRQAAYHFQKAIAANPAYVEAHHRYGLLLLIMGSYDRAQHEFEEAVRLNPQYAPARADLDDLLQAKARSSGGRKVDAK
jgi:tetratricopeptide (TPR) repeat protein